MNGQKILKGIQQERRATHDTLYCHPQHEKALLASVQGMRFTKGEVTNPTVFGLDIQTHPQFVRPIVCQKGDVFPLARDWG